MISANIRWRSTNSIISAEMRQRAGGHQAGWQAGFTRCFSATTNTLATTKPIPKAATSAEPSSMLSPLQSCGMTRASSSCTCRCRVTCAAITAISRRLSRPYNHLLVHSRAAYHYIAMEEQLDSAFVDDAFWTGGKHYGPAIHALVARTVAQELMTCLSSGACSRTAPGRCIQCRKRRLTRRPIDFA